MLSCQAVFPSLTISLRPCRPTVKHAVLPGCLSFSYNLSKTVSPLLLQSVSPQNMLSCRAVFPSLTISLRPCRPTVKHAVLPGCLSFSYNLSTTVSPHSETCCLARLSFLLLQSLYDRVAPQ